MDRFEYGVGHSQLFDHIDELLLSLYRLNVRASLVPRRAGTATRTYRDVAPVISPVRGCHLQGRPPVQLLTFEDLRRARSAHGAVRSVPCHVENQANPDAFKGPAAH